ncbi:MAG: hypothetical protein US62_C0006G0032 [Candidatus Woesebacteria bacterium GW2011_GWA1_37_8]|uniref:Glycosyltransferase 2-like domain-containing protein n=1 Tax=Candidatus Woesebacteria bacterium GW2011_GWA1_37_8 TaxID=1618546 RepID=A0A0G0KZU6_9BACT|nr:MAG: hypothetical protein US62_C0006G0032 [Candidatus Woesebacteria bacterium GW2011_GWA1_37_8]
MIKLTIGVSVVIPSFNNKQKLFRLLNSVQKSNYPNLEIIVVDNSPSSEILKSGRSVFKNVKWVDLGRENLGQTTSYNIGFSNAKRGNHILYCDEDVIVAKDMIRYLVERAESSEVIGIVTPMVLYLENKNWVNQAGAEVNLKTGRVTIGWGPRKNFLKAKKVQGSGTVMLFKNSVLKKIGGFEDWFMCYFDPEYCVRALKAGFENWYEPKAVCYHDQPMDSTKWRPRVLSRAYLLGRNRTLFMRKYGNMFIYTLFLPILLGYYLIESIKFKIFGKWIELVRGTIVGYTYKNSTKLYVPLPINKK